MAASARASARARDLVPPQARMVMARAAGVARVRAHGVPLYTSPRARGRERERERGEAGDVAKRGQVRVAAKVCRSALDELIVQGVFGGLDVTGGVRGVLVCCVCVSGVLTRMRVSTDHPMVRGTEQGVT